MAELTVYYDGDCIICDKEISLYRRLDRDGAIEFVDISSDKFDAASVGLDPVEVNRVFHVKNDDGDFVTKVDAFIEIWKVIPPLKFLAIVSEIPLIKPLLGVGYVMFVKIRPYLPRKKTCETDNCSL